MSLRSLFAALLIAAFLAPTSASAQDTPGHLRDLVNDRTSSGERELRDRGYVHIQTQRGGDRSFGNWWSQSRHECITVAKQSGRIVSIVDSPAFDCNQHHSRRDDDDDGSDVAAGAALAIGAAAIIGALAASDHDHKAHHHESRRHSDDHDYEREFERGHRDGLYHHAYDNDNNTDAYREGFNSGVEQRAHNAAHRHTSRQVSRRESRTYQRVQHTADDFARLSGEQASSTDGTLRSWGFNDVDSFTSGTTRYTIWYNNSTRQCLQMTTANGETVDVSDIGYNRACH